MKSKYFSYLIPRDLKSKHEKEEGWGKEKPYFTLPSTPPTLLLDEVSLPYRDLKCL